MGDAAVPPFTASTPMPFVPCRNHADRATESICGRCADLVCGLCTVWNDGMPYCPACIVKVRALDLARPEGYIPWEDRARLGTLNAAWKTVTLAYSDGEFYTRMPVSGGLADPLLFGMLMRAVVIVLYGVLAAMLYFVIGAATGDPLMFFQAAMQLGGVLFQILQAAVFLFFLSGLIHLGVRVFGGDGGFEATFRVYAYGRGLDLLELIPVAGQLAAAVWRIAIYYRGLQHVHKMGKPGAIVAASIPFGIFVFFFFLMIGLVVLVIVLAASL